MAEQHRGRGHHSLATLRALVTSRVFQRGLWIAGFATVAWLAGATSANADSGGDVEAATSSAPVISDVLDPVTPEHTGGKDSARPSDNRHEKSSVDTHGLLSASRPAVETETPGRVLQLARPLTTSLEDKATSTVMTPLTSAARGKLDAVTEPVDGTLKRIARPVAASAKPIGAMLSWNPSTSDAANAETVRDHHRDATVQATHGAHIADDNQPVPDHWDADGRAGDTAPFAGQAYPGLYGFATPEGTTTGSGPGGSLTHDSGAGLFASAADTAVNAGTSRVNPQTAVTGQLPDHVENPAVSPD